MSSPEARPVIAVIPHYNMPQTLVPLLAQVIEQKYDGVYVLDDNSTNCDIQGLVAPFSREVALIAGEENRGAGGNRNRILEADPKNLIGSILHFIDADVELLTCDNPKAARALFTDLTIGEVGSLILYTGDMQDAHNYNPRISWTWLVGVGTQAAVTRLGLQYPKVARRIRYMLHPLLAEFPNTLTSPKARDVFCLKEANILVPYEIFAEVGGFDPKLRYHEAQDLAYKLKVKGLRRRFDPTIVVRRRPSNVRGVKKRISDDARGIYTIAREYGLPLR